MQQKGGVVVVKKYSNRRLYDTSDSRYITLDELAMKIRAGHEVRVLDAKTNEDLTQPTLTQVILESRRAARLLPVPLLTQLIRMGDDALAEFFGRYMSWALELYLSAKHGAQAVSPFNPFATMPFAATNAVARLFNRFGDVAGPGGAPPSPANGAASEPEPSEPPDATTGEPQSRELDELRAEIEALKAAILERR
jgi:polyhydroxyalkanoate synthesis repressor PhaR